MAVRDHGHENLLDRVLRAVEPEFTIETARSALRIPSVSGKERPVAEFFHRAMADIGLESRLQPVPASKWMDASCNAIGSLRGSGGGNTLLFNGHIDHNPVAAGWTRDPFAAEIEDGWLYGFVHMKAANAAYLGAIRAVQKAGIELRGDVVVANVCGELRGGAGTQHALREGMTADYFVLGEPTELLMGFTHTASIVLKLHVLGRSKHFATEPVPGVSSVNAVETMARAILALGPSHTHIRSIGEGGWMTYQPRAGFEGLPQLNIGPIRGGISKHYDETRPALFPDLCSVYIDVRIVPGMTKASIRADLVRRLEALGDPELRYEIEFQDDYFPHPFEAPRDSDVASAVARAHQHIRGSAPGDCATLKFAASDASYMARAGMTGIIYGPSGRYLSRPDERCEVRDIVDAARVYASVIADLCTRRRDHRAGS